MSKTENKILKKFEATDVIIEVIDGVPMFELYSTGMALGYVNKRISKGKEYITPYKSRIDKTAKNAGIAGLCQGVTTFLNENQLYDFMFEAHTEKCKPFSEYSCAMKSHFRKSGNQMSGKWKSSYARLLA